MKVSTAGRIALATALALMAVDAIAARHEWQFVVLLDGRPIGTHRFTLEGGEDETRTLVSDARFDVKLLGITAYRYRHHARELWRGDCLATEAAHTDDDGQVTDVHAQASADGLTVETTSSHKGVQAASKRATISGCLMSFAYWNPALRAQRRLLDPGSGKVEPVEITAQAPTTIEVGGKPLAAQGWRIGGLAHPIVVWYEGDTWIGLDTSVESGRNLSYRPATDH